MITRELFARSLLPAVVVIVAVSSLLAAPDEREARRCANIVGDALKSGDTSMLRSVLPARGRVQVRLVRLAEREGAFSASQVQAMLKDVLKYGSIRSFSIVHVEGKSDDYALVRARVELTDANGVEDGVDLHLALAVEDERWVLREIRESPR